MPIGASSGGPASAGAVRAGRAVVEIHGKDAVDPALRSAQHRIQKFGEKFREKVGFQAGIGGAVGAGLGVGGWGALLKIGEGLKEMATHAGEFARQLEKSERTARQLDDVISRGRERMRERVENAIDQPTRVDRLNDQIRELNGTLNNQEAIVRQLNEERRKFIDDTEFLGFGGLITDKLLGGDETKADNLAKIRQARDRIDAVRKELAEANRKLLDEQGSPLLAGVLAAMPAALKQATDAQEKWNRRLEEGRQLMEQLRTPQEKFFDAIKDVNGRLADGSVGWKTWGRAVEQAVVDAAAAARAAGFMQAPGLAISSAAGGFGGAELSGRFGAGGVNLEAARAQIELNRVARKELPAIARGVADIKSTFTFK